MGLHGGITDQDGGFMSGSGCNEYYRELGDYVRSVRIEAGISQRELGEKLGYSSGQYISNIERGMCPFPIAKVGEFCRLTGIKPGKLIDSMVNAYREEIELCLAMG